MDVAAFQVLLDLPLNGATAHEAASSRGSAIMSASTVSEII
jgi:hypothetical protein